MSASDLLLLLTNDDGVGAAGLLALKKELSALGRVVVVAPEQERSAVSHGLTLHHPIRFWETSEDHYALAGTPVDCVLLAIRELLPRLPDLVVSGINSGPNLGDDILYSGTVAAAREAALYRIPALATSLVRQSEAPDYAPAARYVYELICEFYPERIPKGAFLNVNLPESDLKEYRFTRQGSKQVASSVEEKNDQQGRKHHWIGPDGGRWIVESDTDYQAVKDRVVSITPLERDQTDYQTLQWYHQESEK